VPGCHFPLCGDRCAAVKAKAEVLAQKKEAEDKTRTLEADFAAAKEEKAKAEQAQKEAEAKLRALEAKPAPKTLGDAKPAPK
jgi:hypothetical protein